MEEQTCWICLGTSAADDARSDWRRPCSCSLVAHESCLLDWITLSRDSAACPQCNAQIVVVQPRSLILDLQRRLSRIVTSVGTTAMVAGVGGSAVAVVWSSLYGHGIISILSMCELDESVSLLRRTARAGRLEDAVSAALQRGDNPLVDVAHWAVRRAQRVDLLTIPLIPVLLVAARLQPSGLMGLPLISIYSSTVRNRAVDGVTPFTAYLLMNYIYSVTYYRLFAPSVIKLQQQLPDLRADEVPEPAQVNGDDRMVVQVNANLRIGDMDLFVNNNNILPQIIESLLFPVCSGLMGTMLTKLIPKFSKTVPNRFVRSMIGGYTLIALKDAFDWYCLYAKVKRSKSRKIRNASDRTR